MGNIGTEFNARVSTIRTRTWTLTLTIITCLIFYFLVTIVTNQEVSWIDLIFLSTIQILMHCLYFPDGDLFGQKDKSFVANKTAYNLKASAINENKQYAKLREFCKAEFEERKKRYIENEIAIIGITEAEFEELKKLDQKQVKSLGMWEFDGKCIFFSKYRKKKLFNLLFKKLPIEPNHPETIMSAIENNGTKAIHDTSTIYRTGSYVFRILKATVIGAVFAYISYKLSEGITFETITSIVMYLTALFSTAVMSFSSGERCSKVFKSRFYLDLSNFIDNFNEWNKGVE